MEAKSKNARVFEISVHVKGAMRTKHKFGSFERLSRYNNNEITVNLKLGKKGNGRATHQLICRIRPYDVVCIAVRLAEAVKTKRKLSRAYKLAERASSA